MSEVLATKDNRPCANRRKALVKWIAFLARNRSSFTNPQQSGPLLRHLRYPPDATYRVDCMCPYQPIIFFTKWEYQPKECFGPSACSKENMQTLTQTVIRKSKQWWKRCFHCTALFSVSVDCLFLSFFVLFMSLFISLSPHFLPPSYPNKSNYSLSPHSLSKH